MTAKRIAVLSNSSAHVSPAMNASYNGYGPGTGALLNLLEQTNHWYLVRGTW